MNKVNLANFKEEYKITESLEKLEQELIGLQSVKDRIQEITAILFMQVAYSPLVRPDPICDAWKNAKK